MSNLATWALSATVLDGASTPQPHEAAALAWLAVALIFAVFGQLIARGVRPAEQNSTRSSNDRPG